MSDLLDTFFQECDDLLEGLSSGLSDMDNGTSDDETVNAMFRSVHSIKGGAGAFGLHGLVDFAHAFENVLDDIRSGKRDVDETVVALLFTAADHLSDLVEAAREGTEVPEAQGASVLSDLKQLAQGVEGRDGTDENAGADPEFTPLALDFGQGLPSLDGTGTVADTMEDPLPPAGNAAAPECGTPFIIEFRAFEGLYATGNEPVLLFRALETLGEVRVQTDLTLLKPLWEDDWRDPQMAWTVTLRPKDGTDLAAIEEVFEFVEGNCALRIRQDDALADPVDSGGEFPAGETGGATPATPGPGEEPASNTEAMALPPAKAKPQPARNSTIRVELQRVDRLINLVGELVIGEAMLRQSVAEQPQFSGSAIEEAMGQLKQLSGVIQESVMAIRAQPVRSLFQRMSRIVRESAREAGKSARLVTIGEGTEVDKTVTERLVEPLTHMVRNAIDHGLELPQDRAAAGKPERGEITLAAAHRSGRVVITLSDDGAGIDRARVRKVAEARGLIRAEEELSDAEIDNLLFRPGFSTAEEVSNLSGRGVGMDVVRSEIQALGGRITLLSEPGKGTSLSISLPLTLAVLEGMVVIVEGEALVVPTLALRETLRPGQAQVHELCDGDLVLSINGELVPIRDLGSELGYRAAPDTLEACALLLIESEAGRRTALAVDKIVDQREVVIKGLDQNYGRIPGIAAATILGDGSIALIIDTDQMIAPSSARMPSGPALPAAALHGPDITGDARHA